MKQTLGICDLVLTMTVCGGSSIRAADTRLHVASTHDAVRPREEHIRMLQNWWLGFMKHTVYSWAVRGLALAWG